MKYIVNVHTGRGRFVDDDVTPGDDEIEKAVTQAPLAKVIEFEETNAFDELSEEEVDDLLEEDAV